MYRTSRMRKLSKPPVKIKDPLISDLNCAHLINLKDIMYRPGCRARDHNVTFCKRSINRTKPAKLCHTKFQCGNPVINIITCGVHSFRLSKNPRYSAKPAPIVWKIVPRHSAAIDAWPLCEWAKVWNISSVYPKNYLKIVFGAARWYFPQAV